MRNRENIFGAEMRARRMIGCEMTMSKKHRNLGCTCIDYETSRIMSIIEQYDVRGTLVRI